MPAAPTTVQLGLANSTYDLQSIRPFAERDKTTVHRSVFDRGDHLATVRAFFRWSR